MQVSRPKIRLAVAAVIAGLLLFFLLRKTTYRELPAYKEDFCAKLHPGAPGGLSAQLRDIADSMNRKTGVYVLEDGGNAMMARAWLCEHAEQSIDIQYFIFATDNVGLIACDYLVRAADRGIKVRLLVDDMMVDASPHDILTLDAHKNIEIKIYNPGVNLGKNLASKLGRFATHFREANQRMHNKTFTVDGKVSITGGRNIADEYFDFDHEFNFRDRDVLLLGNITHGITKSFNEFWTSDLSVPVTKVVEDVAIDTNAPTRYERLHQYACNPQNFWPQVRTRIDSLPFIFDAIKASGALTWTDSISFVSDMPGKNASKSMQAGGITTDTLLSLIHNAKHSIDIQSPYLIPTDEGIVLLAAAVKRGVKVRILTNSLASNDNLAAFAGYQKIRTRLLQTGVRIFEFRPDAKERYRIMTGALQQKMNYTPIFGLHAKSMVIDGHITVIGTFNADPRSANLNTECITIIHSSKIAGGVLQGMEEEYKPENAWETTPDFNPDATAGKMRRAKTWTRKAVPSSIL
ncbi:MAG: phospholipase D family protein [Bacteroidota bacterium]